MFRSTLLAGAGIAALVATAAAQDPARSVSGRIFDQGTGCPLANVHVAVEGSSRAVRTSTQGRYHLGGVPSSAFTLTAFRAGYDSAQTAGVIVDSAGRVDFTLQRAANRSGGGNYPASKCMLEPHGSAASDSATSMAARLEPRPGYNTP